MEADATRKSVAPAEGLETQRLRGALAAKLFDVDVAPVTIGRFEVLSRLGQGAMGMVYRARDPLLDREIAVKVLAPPRGVGATGHSVASTQRLQSEAQTLARLAHPNVLTVLDVGTHDGHPFVAMEVADGGSLAEWMGRHPMGTPGRFATVRAWLRQAALGLAAAHRAGVVHRDIKPQNLLLDAEGVLRIADFGLARVVAAAPQTASGLDRTTQVGAVCGTPAYMAPEQYEGNTDERSDQFSLCAAFWEVACGVRPFGGDTVPAIMLSVVEANPTPPLPGCDAPGWFRRVLLRGMRKRPEDRFASLDALLAELDRIPRRRRIAGSVGLAAALGAGVAAVTMRTLPTDRCAQVPTTLAEAWSAPRRAEVRQRFVDAAADGVAAFEETAARLDTYAADWADGWSDACRATWITGTQSPEDLDARMRCLGRGRAVFVAVTDALRDEPVDLAGRTRVADALAAMPELVACRTVAAKDDVVPLPQDPARRAEVLALHERLVAATARRMGMSPAQMRQVVALQDEVMATRYVPAIVLWARFAAEYFLPMADPRALEVLQDALRRAEDAGLYADATTVAATLSEAAFDLGRSADESERYIRKAESLLPRITDATELALRRSEIDVAWGRQAERTGLPEEALAHYQTALAALEARFGPESADVARVSAMIGQLELGRGRYPQARAALLRALAIREASPNARLRQTEIRSALMRLSFELGEAEAALYYAQRCLDDTLTFAELGAANVIGMRANLAAALVLNGDRQGAASELRAAVADLEQVPDAEAIQVILRLNAAEVIDDAQEVERLTQQAYDLAVVHHGVDSFEYAAALVGKGEVAHAAGKFTEAVARYREALPLLERRGRMRRVIGCGASLARSLLAAGEVTQARQTVDRMQPLAAEAYGADSSRAVELAIATAYVQHAEGDDAAAGRTLDGARAAIADAKDVASELADIAALQATLRGRGATAQ